MKSIWIIEGGSVTSAEVITETESFYIVKTAGERPVRKSEAYKTKADACDALIKRLKDDLESERKKARYPVISWPSQPPLKWEWRHD